MKKYVEAVNGRWGKNYYIKDDEYVGKSIKNYGEYKPDETECILALANHGEGVVLDIGANIDVITQALLHEGFDVLSFEPQPEVYEILTLNCPFSKSYNVAVGSSAGVAYMPRQAYRGKGRHSKITGGIYEAQQY